jgi:hypothetical protein
MPEGPEDQATISNKKDPMTTPVRAGCAKKVFQSPQARIVRVNWTITLTVDVMTICGLRRAIGMNKADLDADTSDAGHGDASVDI